jgi:outer membrane protein W
MKKNFLVLVILALVAGGAFAQVSLSAGIGAFFDASYGNGMEMANDPIKLTQTMDNTSFGGYVFLDATYVEVGMGFAYGTLKSTSELKGTGFFDGSTTTDGSAMQLSFTLLGKYPISLGAATLFPMFGLSYNLILSMGGDIGDGLEASDNSAGDFSQLGLLGGVGLDFDLTQSLYLRVSALFHLRLASKYMTDVVNDVKEINSGTNINTTLGIGPRIQLGLGFRF